VLGQEQERLPKRPQRVRALTLRTPVDPREARGCITTITDEAASRAGTGGSVAGVV
jgi:hypothetical protein